ncbi:MAG: hypothetical protein A3J46_06490 [Candidatus Yanofskybacteria bacterium RIFCSPHIGHO2_02_FULL_41_11]|uniref:Uncharacterized protein n=1 Tax=Candidatus Yanofskybacteria bacterium RIFCSPHIGHO2_02_FULL_41_11 TaxID=1802675 RepID=A0A1F8FA26_9BACT|nr:MAG: hypothetical protein A3J46_06490 [Candidatus Yanofskybacteria bacterium RIFCSPHIGHO2_02_FULL_41_11]
MSFLRKKEVIPQTKSDDSPKETPPRDLLSEEFNELAGEERKGINRRIFDLESAERILLELAIDKESGISPTTSLLEILQKIREELKDIRQVKEVLDQ